MAADEDSESDVLVWLDYAILKQGHNWPGHPPMEDHHITEFVERLEQSVFDDIPFPGIWDKGEIADAGDNWRFVGSTHIIPRHWLHYVDEFYRYECRKFIERTQTVPLVIMAHTAEAGTFRRAVAAIDKLDSVPGAVYYPVAD